VSLSPLAILADTDEASLFENDIVQLVIKIKWNTFGQYCFMKEFFPFVLLVISFVVGFVFDYLPFRIISYILCTLSLSFEECRELYQEGFYDYLQSPYNYLSVAPLLSSMKEQLR